MTTELELASLADRVEKLGGPDREMDLAIHRLIARDERLELILQTRRGLDGQVGQTWELTSGAVIYETRNENSVCWSNGGIPIPACTASLDAAMTLVPEGWFVHEIIEYTQRTWDAKLRGPVVGDVRLYAYARTPTNRLAPATAPIALTAACLRARAAIQGKE